MTDYDEPIDFEDAIDFIAIESILKPATVAKFDTLKAKNERLIKANEELRSKFAEIDQEWFKLNVAKANYKKELKQQGYVALLSELKKEFWKVTRKFTTQPKCDKCDANRKVVFTSPDGRTMLSSCACDSRACNYVVEKMVLAQVKISKKDVCLTMSGDDEHADWYLGEASRDVDRSKDTWKKGMYIGDSIFTSEELAQEFANFLQAQE